MTSLVARMLPTEFLQDLGVFMQTAAHTELAVWQCMMAAEGLDSDSAVEHRKFIEIKLNTKSFRSRVRESAKVLPEALRTPFLEICDKLDGMSEVRNLAAHGAFFRDEDKVGTLGAAHYFIRRIEGSKTIFEVQQSFRRDEVKDIISEADELLRSAVRLRSEIHLWRDGGGVLP
ncbi:hypothetical protein GCM10011360_06570 [Primorskyibacter flagellatus]|uniref:Uncharacterized protein n=1 Tax=Primorskyibacter flagellatus TaxID=1387277 RepID=A0A916ZZU1_9RHOB|nr:hypothetical protein [Primorskyibacter flagellatus]GGE20593.1 hypothetical protein GCM10011360_06570 [Primorskyibacter flagellatus]